MNWGLVGAVSGALLALAALAGFMWVTAPRRRRRHERQLDDQTVARFAQRHDRMRQQ